MNNKIMIGSILSFLLLFGMAGAQSIAVPNNIYANSTFPITVSGLPSSNMSLITINVAGNVYPILYTNTTATTFGFINSTGNYTITASEFANNTTTQIASIGISVLPNPNDVIQANLTQYEANTSADLSNLTNSTSVLLNSTNNSIATFNSTLYNLTNSTNNSISAFNSTLANINSEISAINSSAISSISSLNGQIGGIDTALSNQAQVLNSINSTMLQQSNTTTSNFASVNLLIQDLTSGTTQNFNSVNLKVDIAYIIGIIGIAVGGIALLFRGKGKKPKDPITSILVQEAKAELKEKDKEKENAEKLKEFEEKKAESKQEASIEYIKERMKKDREFNKLKKEYERAKRKYPDSYKEAPETKALIDYAKRVYNQELEV
jgi:hypothetical protein